MNNEISPEIESAIDKLRQAASEFNHHLAFFIKNYGDDFDVSAYVKVVDGEPQGVNVRISRLYGTMGP